MAHKILLIEGDSNIRQKIAGELKKQNFSVQTAKDGPTGMRIFKNVIPDLLVSNLVLGDMTAFEVCEKIRAHPEGENIGIILVSNSTRSKKYIDGLSDRYQVFRFLQKPFDPNDLIKIVKEYLNQNGNGAGKPRKSSPKKSTSFVTPPPSPKNAPKYFPGVLLFYHESKATGLLHVRREKDSKTIYLEKGNPVGVESKVRKEHLGQVLVEKGVISEEDYLKAARQMVEEGCQLGEALVKMGTLDSSVLSGLVQEHQVTKIANSFHWMDAEMEIEFQDPLPRIKNKKKIPLEEIFEVGLRQLRKIPKIGHILKPLSQEYMSTNSLFEEYQSLLKISDQDLSLVKQIECGYQLEEILNSKTEPLLVTLYLCGMLERAQPNVDILLKRLEELKKKAEGKDGDTLKKINAQQEKLREALSAKEDLESKAQLKAKEAEEKAKALNQTQKELDEAKKKLEEMEKKLKRLEQQKQSVETKPAPTEPSEPPPPADQSSRGGDLFGAPSEMLSDGAPDPFNFASLPSQPPQQTANESPEPAISSTSGDANDLFELAEEFEGLNNAPSPNNDSTMVMPALKSAPTTPTTNEPAKNDDVFALADQMETDSSKPAPNPEATMFMAIPPEIEKSQPPKAPEGIKPDEELTKTLEALEASNFSPENPSVTNQQAESAKLPIDPFAPANVREENKSPETKAETDDTFDDFFSIPGK